MVKKRLKAATAKVLALAMVLSIPEPVSALTTEDESDDNIGVIRENIEDSEDIETEDGFVLALADEGNFEFTTDGATYAIAAVPEDESETAWAAVNTKGLGWQTHTKVDSEYYTDEKSLLYDTSQFKITKVEDITGGGVKVKIECVFEEGEYSPYPLRTESGNDYAFADNDPEDGVPKGRHDESMEYIINITDSAKGIGTIQAGSNNRYATIDGDELRFLADTSSADAQKFMFVKNPTVDSSKLDPRTYAIVSNTKNKALRTNVNSWVTNSIMIDTDYSGNEVKNSNIKFVVTPVNNPSGLDSSKGEVKVKIRCEFDGEMYTLRVGDMADTPFADPQDRYNDDNFSVLTIIKTGVNTGKIKIDSSSKYFTIEKDGDTDVLGSKAESLDAAEEFTFIENPVSVEPEPSKDPDKPTDPDKPDNPDTPTQPDGLTYSIEHVKSGKYIKMSGYAGAKLSVNGNKGDAETIFSAVFGKNDNNQYGEGLVDIPVVSFIYGNFGMKSVDYINDGAAAEYVTAANKGDCGSGWESVQLVPNGDGTVSFKDSYFSEYITVDGSSNLKCRSGIEKEKLTDNEKFIIHISAEKEEDKAPFVVTDIKVVERTRDTIELAWTNPNCVYTSLELWMKEETGTKQAFKKAAADSSLTAAGYRRIAELADENSYTVTGLEQGKSYSFKLLTVYQEGSNGEKYSSDDNVNNNPDGSGASNEISAETRVNDKPGTPTDVHIEETSTGLKLNWSASKDAKSYKIMRAPSMYGTYKEVKTVTETSAAIEKSEYNANDKYSNYFHIIALNVDEESDESECTSLETEMFGSHTLIFAETDDVKKVDARLLEIFNDANDIKKDAQFNGEHWQIYFKPGDYTETSCMYVGFYTSFNGLGKTPYDVRLNNIGIPAYLPKGELSDTEDNATCNFWRSAENLSVIDTGNDQGKAAYGSYRPDWFNWAVAQAAPLRRVFSERPVAYDWNFGWASGGYVADCYFIGKGDKDNGAGTASGQQFYTRNSVVEGNTFGTTLNNFFQGVIAANNLDATTGQRMYKDNGYTNWGLPGADGGHQVVTEVENTPVISEKPFLYLDNGEYKVFVPAIRKNAAGISWGEDDMGEGVSLSLDEFYIAKPEDTAAIINTQIKAGKNIYFTPGIYNAEVPIEVDRENAILLGTGMTTIIPDNEDMAMKVSDLDGIRIEGLIFDAGLSSRYLLQVGDKGTHKDHSANPIILQDLFFRVGGTTDVLTKSDDALEINSDNTICDHFWIWRADHGAGVEWYGNESKHGLIVNGDYVKCYALFNEHFQEYHTLWNGEYGETYFYQNETCYDPISQDAWMSHGGTVNGYSSYKVSNDVEHHYAVGLGIYNVFIYTGPTYDATEVSIQLDNAIEVPNSLDVIVENACIQSFANADGAPQIINHIVNGVGGSAGNVEGWSRKFLLFYNNGKTIFGKETDGSDAQKNKFIGLVGYGLDESEKNDYVDEVYDELVPEPADEKISIDRLESLYNEYVNLQKESGYTDEAWQAFVDALAAAKIQIDIGKAEMGKTHTQSEIYDIQGKINKACSDLEAAIEGLKKGSTVNPPATDPDNTKKPDNTNAPNNTNSPNNTKSPDNTQSPNGSGNSSGGGGGNTTNSTVIIINGSPAPGNTTAPSSSAEPDSSQNPSQSTAPTDSNNGNGSSGTKKKISSKKINLNRTEVYIVKGKSLKIKGVMQPYNTTDKIKWSTSKKSVATVKNGKITAKKTGTALITAKTTSGKKDSCIVHVVKKAKKATSLKLNKSAVTIDIGKKVILKPVFKPIKSTSKVTWKSSNKSVASVDAYGVVTAKKKGKTTITATTGNGKKAKCVVFVQNDQELYDMVKVIYDILNPDAKQAMRRTIIDYYYKENEEIVVTNK